MSTMRLAFGVVVVLAGCAPAPSSDTAEEGLTFRAPIEKAAGVQIVGHSSDARRIAYVTNCDASGGAGTELKLWDDWTGELVSLAKDVMCFPNLVQFSPDGELAAWGVDGQISIHRASSGDTVVVAKIAEGIGVDFSPDSSWLVVASRGAAPVAATLTAWDADLQHHHKIADGAFYSPFAFGGPFANIQFSPDARQLLFLGQLAAGFPIGTLSLWTRATGKTRTIASGVAATGYVVDGAWTRVAYLRDTAPVTGPPGGLAGTLATVLLSGGAEKIIGTTPSGFPLALARDGAVVVYCEAATVKAFVVATGKIFGIDTNAFTNLGVPSVKLSPRGDALAYLTAWDPMIGGGELRLATVPDGPGTPAPRVIASKVVVNSYGFADGGGALAYLHDPDATFPGAALGKLSAFDVDQGTTTAIASGVTQQSIKIDSAHQEILFEDKYDGSLAAGDLESWDARTAKTRLVGKRASVMSIARSPSGTSVGFIQLAKNAPPDQPPAVSLMVGAASGIGSASKVDDDATSFVLGSYGRVLYAKPSGLWGAFVF